MSDFAKDTNVPTNDCISRQEAIDAINQYGSVWMEYTDDMSVDEIADRALKASEQSMIKILHDLPSAQQWIPVSEMLPKEEEGTYWVCTDTGAQCECRWTNINHIWTDLTTNWHWHIFDLPYGEKVIAWMNLPEPYRGDSDA